MYKTALSAAAGLLLLFGCSSPGGGPFGLVLFDKDRHVPSAGPLFSTAEDQCLSASFLLSVFSRTGQAPEESPRCRSLRSQMQSFLPEGNLYALKNTSYDKRSRNEVVNTLIMESNRKCGDYVHFLQAYQSNVRASSGILAQATAILATVTSGGTAQGFAAASGIIGGAGGTLQEASFANQTVAILVQAFDNARAEQLAEMTNLQQCTPAQYPLTRAMADVFRYHSSCSIVTGLQHAQRAVEEVRSPSLEGFMRTLKQIEEVRPLLPQSPITSPDTSKRPASVPAPALGGGQAGAGNVGQPNAGGNAQPNSGGNAQPAGAGTNPPPPPDPAQVKTKPKPSCPFGPAVGEGGAGGLR